MLQRGVDRTNDPFHWPVLGTTTKGGPRMRTIILRQFNLPDRALVCHTDSRADKVQEISCCHNVSWLFYHPKKKIQLRVSGPATLHTDDRVADEHWAASKITSRLNYCTIAPPGSIVDHPSSGLSDLLLKKAPTLLESETDRKNFMVIAGQIQSMDWLQLNVLGNRRARFDWASKGLEAT